MALAVRWKRFSGSAEPVSVLTVHEAERAILCAGPGAPEYALLGTGNQLTFHALGRAIIQEPTCAEGKSEVIKIDPYKTSQRCPKCGTVRKENRHHDIHEYICDNCGYRSNDDRIGAMNIQMLGMLWLSGDEKPSIKKLTTAE